MTNNNPLTFTDQYFHSFLFTFSPGTSVCCENTSHPCESATSLLLKIGSSVNMPIPSSWRHFSGGIFFDCTSMITIYKLTDQTDPERLCIPFNTRTNHLKAGRCSSEWWNSFTVRRPSLITVVRSVPTSLDGTSNCSATLKAPPEHSAHWVRDAIGTCRHLFLVFHFPFQLLLMSTDA